jgi:hypothetical protein
LGLHTRGRSPGGGGLLIQYGAGVAVFRTVKWLRPEIFFPATACHPEDSRPDHLTVLDVQFRVVEIVG